MQARSTWRVFTAGAVAVALAIAMVVGGCNGPGQADTQQRNQTISMGRFDGLPLVPGSQPFGSQTDANRIVTQSFRVTGQDPAQILDFYASALPPKGWVRAEPAYRAEADNRADWVREGYRLELSAVRAKDANPDASQAVVQYSLVLRPE